MTDRYRSVGMQQHAPMAQWQIDQQVAWPPWRLMGRQTTAMSRPLGSCFACDELGHLRHQCQKTGSNPGAATAPRISHLSSVSYVECYDTQVLEYATPVLSTLSRSEVKSSCEKDEMRYSKYQGMSAREGNPTVISKLMVRRIYDDECIVGIAADDDFNADKEIINGVRYWQTDGQTSTEHVKEQLKKNVKFWRGELMAPENIIRVIEDGYILPFLSVPNAYGADNQRSARENDEFVIEEVSKLVNNGCGREVAAQPFVCSPLSVVINAKGKSC